MFIIKHKKIFIGISTTLVILSLVSLFVFRLKIGIDFKGGALTEIVYKTTPPAPDGSGGRASRPTQTDLAKPLADLNFGSISLQPTGDLGYIVKSRDLSDTEHTLLLNTLSENNSNPLTELSFNSIGPSVGAELTRKAILAVILISIAIICFIAFAFRKVSKPISSWKYGIIAIVTLLHDVAIPVGIFVILSHFYGAEVDSLFV